MSSRISILDPNVLDSTFHPQNIPLGDPPMLRHLPPYILEAHETASRVLSELAGKGEVMGDGIRVIGDLDDGVLTRGVYACRTSVPVPDQKNGHLPFNVIGVFAKTGETDRGIVEHKGLWLACHTDPNSPAGFEIDLDRLKDPFNIDDRTAAYGFMGRLMGGRPGVQSWHTAGGAHFVVQPTGMVRHRIGYCVVNPSAQGIPPMLPFAPDAARFKSETAVRMPVDFLA